MVALDSSPTRCVKWLHWMVHPPGSDFMKKATLMMRTTLFACGLLSCSQEVDESNAWRLGDPDMGHTEARDDGTYDLGVEPLQDMMRDLGEVAGEDMTPATHSACVDPMADTCVVVEDVDFGDCGLTLGYVFDGRRCVEVTGCPCEGESCSTFFSDAIACASTCERAGYCQRDVLSKYLAPASTCEGVSCYDTMAICIASQANPEETIEALLPGFGDFRCDNQLGSRDLCAFASNVECPEDSWCCEHYDSGPFIEGMSAHTLCAVTLLDATRTIGCYQLE